MAVGLKYLDVCHRIRVLHMVLNALRTPHGRLVPRHSRIPDWLLSQLFRTQIMKVRK